MNSFCKKISAELSSRGIISNSDRILVALSGGADSVALLYAMSRIYQGRIFACHVNHGIRGDEADRDENFCRELCKKLNITLRVSEVNVPDECAKTGEGLEECARRLRYAELNSAARHFGCAFIATAHHADDNIETVLLHMIRGCGLRGLTGIPYMRGNIIRPLLPFSRSEIIKALESEGIQYVCDSTNSDLDMSRNLLRHTVLPQIYKLNPSADATFGRMCASLSKDEMFIEKCVSSVPADADRNTLSALEDAILNRVISKRYSDFGGGTQITNTHISDISNALRNSSGNFEFTLPGKITAYVGKDGLTFARDSGKIVYEQQLNFGENIISSCRYKIFITQDKNVAIKWKNIYKLSTSASVISDKILNGGVLKLFARSPKAGDRICFGKTDRSVLHQLKNCGIPEYRRRNLPRIVTDSDEIIFVPGLPTADAYNAKNFENIIFIVFADENIYG